MIPALVTLWLTNILDCLFTSKALERGAGEGNPMMAVLIHWLGLEGTITLKVAWVTAGVFILWRLRRYPGVARATTLLTLVYVVLVLYEAVMLA